MESLKPMPLSTLIKNSIGGGVALIGLSLLAPASAFAVTITFDPLSNDGTGNPVGTETEGGFTYTQTYSGSGGFFTQDPVGNPAPALTTLGADSQSITIEFRRTDGGLFTFDSFEAASAGNGVNLSDRWLFRGFNGVTEVGAFDTARTATTFTTTTVNPSLLTGEIDRLVISWLSAGGGGGPLAVDNLVLTPQASQSTPEPGTILGLLAVGALGAVSRKRKV